MEKKRKLSLGDKIWTIETQYNPDTICPTCKNLFSTSKKFVSVSILVTSLILKKPITQKKNGPYQDVLYVNNFWIEGSFYYTKKEAQCDAVKMNKSFKKIKQEREEFAKGNPVRGLKLKLYPIKGE